MNKKITFVSAALSSILLSACIGGGDDDPMSYIYSSFTIKPTSNGVAMYMDGGGIVYPTAESINEITQNKGFGDVKRAFFQIQYDQSLVTDNGDGTGTFKGVKLLSGNSIPTTYAMTREDALSKNVLVEDSIFGCSDITNLWVYRGYLNVGYKTTYYAKSGGGYHVPTSNIIIEQDPANVRNLDITFVVNKHSKKGDRAIGEAEIVNSFDITQFSHLFPVSGFDSINYNIHYIIENGLKEENKTIKDKRIAVKDFFYPW